MKKVHLGFELGTGNAIEVPIAHMAVVGQTQSAGKTTTLEALVDRSSATALTFITKRGESSFAEGRRITPYFRDRADWQFVTSIIDATLQEKNKFLRPWIMKICRTTQTLAEVQFEIRKALKKAHGISEGVYTQLDAYLDLIVPEIERADMAETLDLAPGINVMDVSSFATPMQMLFVQSALDWINEKCRDTIVVIPEAWEFVPEGKGSPVKASAIALVRKGAGIHNFIWVDSQDMAGVDKTILRGCTVWLIGVQREANEIKRNLLNIPAGIQRPSAADVAMLEKGEFFACFGRSTIKVYVQPKWMNPDVAREVATGARDVHDILYVPPIREDDVTREEAERLRARNDELSQGIAELERRQEFTRKEIEAELAPAWFRRGVEASIEALKTFGVSLQANEFASSAAIHFKAIESNTDPATISDGTHTPVTLHRAGKPLKAGEIDKVRTGNSGKAAGEKLRAALERFPHGAKNWQEVCIVAGMQSGNGYFYGGRKWLVENRLAIEIDNRIEASNVTGKLPKRAEIIDLWTGKLAEPSGRMLRAVASSPDVPLLAETLCDMIATKPRNGYWYGGIARLRDNGLIDQNGSAFSLSAFMRSLK